MGKDLNGKELGKGLSQRADGDYLYRYSKNKVRMYERFKTLSEAKHRKKEIEYWKEHSVLGNNNRITLNTWFEYSMTNIHTNIKTRTLDHYRYLYDYHVREYIGDIFICDIYSVQCNEVINRMYEKGYATSTISDVRKMLKMLFDEAIEDDRIMKNPVNKNVRKAKIKRLKERIALTDAELAEFEENARGSIHYAMMMLAAYTGLRAGELGGLYVDDYDRERGILHINKTLRERKHRDSDEPFYSPKTETSERSIVLTRQAKEIIELQLKARVIYKSKRDVFEPLLFKTRTGNPVFPEDLRKAIKYTVRRCNNMRLERDGDTYTPFPEIYPHAMRRTFATSSIRKGVNIKVVQEYLGHADVKITLNTYTDLSRENEYIRSEIAKIDAPVNLENMDLSNVVDISKYKGSKIG